MQEQKQTSQRWIPWVAMFVAAVLSLASTSKVFGQVYDPVTGTDIGTDPNDQFPVPTPEDQQHINDLNSQIDQKNQQITDLQQQAQNYQQQIDQESNNIASLNSEINQLDTQIALTEVEIQSKQQEIDKLGLELESLQISIDNKTAEINARKEQLAQSIVVLDQQSRTGILAQLLTNDNLASFYDAFQANASLADNIQQSVHTLNSLKQDLESKQNDVSKKKDDLELAKLQLSVKNDEVSSQKNLKENYLQDSVATKSDLEKAYQDLESQEVNARAVIASLQNQLQQSFAGDATPTFSSTGYIWPLHGVITATFHDPTYPFNYLYCHGGLKPPACGHPAIDIAISPGTPVRATADGVVVVAVPSSSAAKLSYVSLCHSHCFDGGSPKIVSNYLHLTKVFVVDKQVVKQGDIIGLSGGAYGGIGSGLFVRGGGHLHFEIWKDGVDQNPLNYLE